MKNMCLLSLLYKKLLTVVDLCKHNRNTDYVNLHRPCRTFFFFNGSYTTLGQTSAFTQLHRQKFQPELTDNPQRYTWLVQCLTSRLFQQRRLFLFTTNTEHALPMLYTGLVMSTTYPPILSTLFLQAQPSWLYFI